MKNTNKEFAEALHLMYRARNMMEDAQDAIFDCFNYLEQHTEKNLRQYGTDVRFCRTLHEAIMEYINGDQSVEDEYKTLEYDIKDAMEVRDYEHHN